MTPLATVCDANPLAGDSEKIRRPSVRMIRQPPEYVPSEIAPAADRITHSGIPPFGARCPDTVRASAITPIVFCASWVPWPNAIVADDAIWA